jgi:hypothetical protein
MNEWRDNWANSEEAKIFTPEVLNQLGFESVDQLPQNKQESKEYYKQDLIKRGVPEDEAERLTNEMFTGIDKYTSFHEAYVDDYNNKLANQNAEVIKLD